MVQWEGGRFLILSKGGGRRVSQRFGDKLHHRPASGTVQFSMCVNGIWMMKVKVVGIFHWLMLLWVIVASNEKKTVFQSFREVVIDLVFRKLKLVCQCWQRRSALELKT